MNNGLLDLTLNNVYKSAPESNIVQTTEVHGLYLMCIISALVWRCSEFYCGSDYLQLGMLNKVQIFEFRF